MTFFLRPRKRRLPSASSLAQIPSVQPAFVSLAHRTKSALLPIARGNIFAADQNFAVRPEPEFAAGKNFADRSFCCAKGSIQADERSGFRHAVALHHGVADAFEEILGFRGKRGAAGDERPEFPARASECKRRKRQARNQNDSFCRGGISGVEPARQPRESISRSRPCAGHPACAARQPGSWRAPALMERSISAGRRGIFKDDGRAKKRRNEKRHELAEHMAERNRGNKSQRMQPALVIAMFVDALFERLEVREEVAVGKHNAARFAGGAGSEEDFCHVVASRLDRPGCLWLRRLPRRLDHAA